MVATIEWGYAKSSDRKPVRCKPLPGQPLLEARSEGGPLRPTARFTVVGLVVNSQHVEA